MTEARKTAFDFEAVLREEMAKWDHLIDDIMRIPDTVFRASGLSAFEAVAFREGYRELREEKYRNLAESADARFEALCQSVPSVPRGAVEAASMGYAVLTMTSEALRDKGGETEAVSTLLSSAMARGMAMARMICSVETNGNDRDALLALTRTEIARAGVAAKLARDPKQAAKATVKECWEAWQEEPDRYKSKAAFARDMLNKFEHLESQPVIEGWCRAWERKH